MKVTRTSEISGRTVTLELPVTASQMQRLEAPNRKEAIQTIFPTLAAPYREFLKSGISPLEWKDMFGDPFGVNQQCVEEQQNKGCLLNEDEEEDDSFDEDDEADHFGLAPELPTSDDEPRSYAEDDSDS